MGPKKIPFGSLEHHQNHHRTLLSGPHAERRATNIYQISPAGFPGPPV